MCFVRKKKKSTNRNYITKIELHCKLYSTRSASSNLFPIRGKHVTSRATKLTNSLGKPQLKVLTCICSVCAPWSCGKFVGVKQTILSGFFSHFELGGITKQVSGLAGNSEFCFPYSCLEVHWGSLRDKTHSFPWSIHVIFWCTTFFFVLV